MKKRSEDFDKGGGGDEGVGDGIEKRRGVRISCFEFVVCCFAFWIFGGFGEGRGMGRKK